MTARNTRGRPGAMFVLAWALAALLGACDDGDGATPVEWGDYDEYLGFLLDLERSVPRDECAWSEGQAAEAAAEKALAQTASRGAFRVSFQLDGETCCQVSELVGPTPEDLERWEWYTTDDETVRLMMEYRPEADDQLALVDMWLTARGRMFARGATLGGAAAQAEAPLERAAFDALRAALDGQMQRRAWYSRDEAALGPTLSLYYRTNDEPRLLRANACFPPWARELWSAHLLAPWRAGLSRLLAMPGVALSEDLDWPGDVDAAALAPASDAP